MLIDNAAEDVLIMNLKGISYRQRLLHSMAPEW